MKKLLLIFLSCLMSYSIFGQDTIYLNNKKQIVPKIEATFYKISSPKSKTQKEHFEKTYLINGKLKFVTLYETKKKKKILKHSAWYDEGEKYLEANFKKGKKDGLFLSFWRNGKLRRRDIYKKGKFQKGVCWNINGDVITHFKYRKEPKFPEGNKNFSNYLRSNITIANKENTLVKVKYFINCDGEISDVQLVKKSNNQKLDNNIVIAIINMPKWEPAKEDGINVGVWRTLPLRI